MTRIALITGGSRGIGKATVLRLIRDGWHVAFTYLESQDDAQALASESSGRAIAIQADVRDPSSGDKVMAAVVEHFGRLDALVNNAGIRRDALFYNMSSAEWSDVLETNLGGVWSMTKAALTLMMRQRGGAIVNVASLSALHGVAGQTNYSAAKGALVAMTRSLSRETARSGIRVNCVAPGLVETGMTATLDLDAKKEMIRQIPMRRAIRPEEIAAGIAFLLSDDASGMTGQVLVIDGGVSA